MMTDDATLIRVQAADGTWHQLETWVRDLTHDPNVGGIVITSRDVTERQEAEAKVRLLYEVLEASTDLVLLCEPGGRLLYANAIARDLMGVVEGDNTVHDIDRFLAPASVTLFDEILASIESDFR